MDYAGSTSLYSYLKKKENRKCEESEAKNFFHQIVEAIHYSHENDIIHRDIKMENIIIDKNKTVKVIDYGFGLMIPSDRFLNLLCGTPFYMSPEIVSKKNYTGKPCDVWALGVLLYYIVCGTFPFKG